MEHSLTEDEIGQCAESARRCANNARLGRESCQRCGGTGDEPPDFKEYGEDAADGVEMIECPACGHSFPK